MLNKNVDIPQNILELVDDQFFKFVKQFYGEKIASVLEFQDINNVECLLACKDPLEILTMDSDDLLDLKKKTCVKLNNNTYAVLPGIKSKMNILKNVLVKKCNQLKKITSTASSNDATTNSLLNDNSTNSADESVQSRATTTHASLNVNLNTEEQIKQNLIKSLNDWSRDVKKFENREASQFEPNTDYEIIVDIKAKKVLIICQCGTAATLGQKNDNYLLSNYIRHLTNRNPCIMVKQKLKPVNEIMINDVNLTSDNTDTSIDPISNSTSDFNLSTQTPLEKRKTNEVDHLSSVKKKKKNK